MILNNDLSVLMTLFDDHLNFDEFLFKQKSVVVQILYCLIGDFQRK